MVIRSVLLLLLGLLLVHQAAGDCSAIDSAFINIYGEDNSSPIYTSLYALGSAQKNYTLRTRIRTLALELNEIINAYGDDPNYKTILEKFDTAFDANTDKAPIVEELVQALSVDFTDVETETNHKMTVGEMLSCVRDAAVCDAIGDAVTGAPSKLWQAISNACACKCIREDDKAVLAFANKLEYAIESLSNSELKIRKAQELIAAFLKQNSGTQLETLILESNIPDIGTVSAFVKCGGGDKGGYCDEAHTVLVDTDGQGSCEMHKALNCACLTLTCNLDQKTAITDASYDVSDIIIQSHLTANEKLVLVGVLVNALTYDLVMTGPQILPAFMNITIASWGTMSEFIDCSIHAECIGIIERAFELYDDSGFCLIIEMMEECSECKVGELMEVTDWVETKLMENENFATMTPAEKAELIYAEMESLSRTVRYNIETSHLMEFGGRSVTVGDALECIEG